MRREHTSVMPSTDRFSLEAFERQVHRRRHEEAIRELLKFLRFADHRQPPEQHDPGRLQLSAEDYYTRTASAVSALLADEALLLSAEGWASLIPYHRHLSSLFGATAFGNADHVLKAMRAPAAAAGAGLEFRPQDIPKLALLYSAHSNLELVPEGVWKQDRKLAVSLFLAMLANPVVASHASHRKGGEVIEWLAGHADEIELADHDLPWVHLPWFQASYYSTPDKHRIKAVLNRAIRRRLLASGVVEPSFTGARPGAAKPVAGVVVEQFTSDHAMYRCYAPAVSSLRSRFRVVGIGEPGVIDEISRACFDEVVGVPAPSVMKREMADAVLSVRPDVLLYPSVGMSPATVFLSNLRLAPVQVMGLGHPATSNSAQMDYVVVEEGFLNDPGCFMERIVVVPGGSMHFTPHPALTAAGALGARNAGNELRIAMPAFARKISPLYLDACRQIAAGHGGPLSFHVLAGVRGPFLLHLTREIRRFLPQAVVYPYLDYAAYMQNLGTCDFSLNPFPFGNTNGIADTAALGMPFVCMDGPEVHSHVDAELSRRLGLPDWLAASTPAQYVEAGLRLAKSAEERSEISARLVFDRINKAFYEGNTTDFCEAVFAVYRCHERIMADERKVWRFSDLRELDGR